MGKISNVISMVQILASGRKYSVSELSEILEVTPRMIRFYKEELEKAGIYIDTIKGPYGGYVLTQNTKLPLIEFKENDINLLKSLYITESNLLKKKEISLLIDKIQGIYSNYSTHNSKFIDDDHRKLYNTLTKSIKEKRRVKITYYSFNKGENIRTINPAFLFLHADGWYVAAYCERVKDIRHFELNRIKEFELLESTFN